MKYLQLLGALFISASPVQASKTFKQVTQPCKASEETQNACDAMAIHFGTMSFYAYLCRLEQVGKATPEMFPSNPKVSGNVRFWSETVCFGKLKLGFGFLGCKKE